MHKSPTPLLQLEVNGSTALVTFNNPPAHVWNSENLKGMEKLVATLEADPKVQAIVITGSGEKFFSAGADLKQFADGSRETARRLAEEFGALECLHRSRLVSIAAINGYAMGGGLEAALACDIRIAEEHAQMALPEGSVGLLPCGGGTQNLTWLVGEGWAKRMILCGERVDAKSALQIGLIEEIVAKGQAKTKALELATKVANQSPDALGFCKKLIQNARGGPMEAGFARERSYFVELFGKANQKEGTQAFLEKRKPVWK